MSGRYMYVGVHGQSPECWLAVDLTYKLNQDQDKSIQQAVELARDS